MQSFVLSFIINVIPDDWKFWWDTFVHNIPSIRQYKLHWKIVKDEIIFEAHVETLGWIGLGFSPNGGMTGADIVIGVKSNTMYLYVSI